MSFAQSLFEIGNLVILPCWALLIFFPKSRVTQRVMGHPRLSPPHLLALLYALVVIPTLATHPEALAALARPTLDGVQQLLGSASGAAAGWIHYLCFDLFIGIHVWRTAQKREQTFLWVSPLLALVLMLGPLGWLSYEVLSNWIPMRPGLAIDSVRPHHRV
jgi:hypothetical protein